MNMIYITEAISKDGNAMEKFGRIERILEKSFGFRKREIVNPERKFKPVYMSCIKNGYSEDEAQGAALAACLDFLEAFNPERDFLAIIYDSHLASSHGCREEMRYLTEEKGLKKENIISLPYREDEYKGGGHG